MPGNKVEIKYKVKDSKFFGNISPVKSREEAEEFVSRIKDEYSDATHNVNAYIIGQGDEALEYADDDGEPTGSSGPPVLKAINGENLTNTVVVVTRYFGGTKLGIGGLIRAYGDTARKVIDVAEKKELKLCYKIVVKGTYNNIGTIMGQVEAYHGNIVDTEYGNDSVLVNFYIMPGKYEPLRKSLIEKTGNRVEINIEDKLYV